MSSDPMYFFISIYFGGRIAWKGERKGRSYSIKTISNCEGHFLISNSFQKESGYEGCFDFFSNGLSCQTQYYIVYLNLNIAMSTSCSRKICLSQMQTGTSAIVTETKQQKRSQPTEQLGKPTEPIQQVWIFQTAVKLLQSGTQRT